MSKTWVGGSTRAWRRIRARVLDRDGHRCRLQTPGVCTTTATPGEPLQVHHTVAREVAGDDPAHLLTACGPCNRHAGDPRGAPDPAPRPANWWTR